jgi:hypothetical protein
VMNFIACILHLILFGWLNQRMWWAGHVAHVAEGTGIYRVLVGRPKGKKPLRRRRHRWEDIKVDLRGIGINGETGFSWLGIGSSGGLMWTLWWAFGFHKESRIFFDRLSDGQLLK